MNNSLYNILSESNLIKNIINEESNINEYRFNFIEKVIYINLEKREDRKEQVEKELLLYFDPKKIIRFNAIYDDKGIIGCVKSHINVIEMAFKNNWDNCLIVEDDVMWNNFNDGYTILEKINKNNYDVIVFGGTFSNYNSDYKLNECKTTTAYLIKKHYYLTLLNNFKESLNLLLETNDRPNYSLDIYWNKLQKTDNWYIIVPSLCIQRPSFSNIENCNVDYNQFYNF